MDGEGVGRGDPHSTPASALSCLVCAVANTTQTRPNNTRALDVVQPLNQTVAYK